jgi:hypothetical protein
MATASAAVGAAPAGSPRQRPRQKVTLRALPDDDDRAGHEREPTAQQPGGGVDRREDGDRPGVRDQERDGPPAGGDRRQQLGLVRAHPPHAAER